MQFDLECKKCGYRFRSKNVPKKCPYCDKLGSVDQVQTAQDLLDETVADRQFFDRD